MQYKYIYIFISIQIILGFLVADILGGIFHWFEDTYLDYCIDLPVLGTISRDNELHHYFPRSMLAYSYLEHISVTLPIAIIMLLLLWVFSRSVFKYKYFIISLLFFSVITNIIHRFSHMRDCENNSFILFLQKTGIICSHHHHSMHHTKTTEKYCVISEYNNYILDQIYFWRILESLIYVITGVRPNRKLKYDDYYMIHNHMHANAKLECPDTPTRKDVDELIEKLREYKHCNKETA